MGKYAFRKLGEDGIRRPINKAIYEAWCRNLFLLDDREIAFLAKNGQRVCDDFLGLSNDTVFLRMLKASDKKSFSQRFLQVEGMFRRILHDLED